MSNWKDKVWTQEEIEQLRQKRAQGLGFSEIAQQMERSFSSVNGKWYGLQKEKQCRGRIWTKEEEQLLIDKYVELGPEVIAEKLGRNRKSVISKVHNLRAPRRQDTRREWTKEEESFIQEFYEEIGPQECAHRLNRSLSSVGLKATAIGLTNDERGFWTKEEENKLKQYCQEWSIADLQELFQRSRMSIIRKRQAMNLPTKPDDYRGKDGNFYDSKQEKDIADLMYNAGIGYKKNVQKFYYNSVMWFRPDFTIEPNIVIEYFGLFGGPYPDYQGKINRKILFFKTHREYIFVALYPEDLRNGRVIDKVKEVLRDFTSVIH